MNIADYEYSLYLGKQNKVVLGDYQRAVDELKNSGLTRALPQPEYEEAGPQVPEVWRLMAPGLARHNYYPFSPLPRRTKGLCRAQN